MSAQADRSVVREEATLKRVLFVCIGNTCRSPMAEALANHYGSDVLRATSAGIAPTNAVTRNTVLAMSEMNIDVSGHLPRLYNLREAGECDFEGLRAFLKDKSGKVSLADFKSH